MLRQLRIENFVLARQAELLFAPGLNLITGETGAGKSLIVDALSMVLGARAEASFVRQGEERALVEAIFDLSERGDVVERLAQAGFDAPGRELLVRREIGADGRSRAFLGSSGVTIGVLREMTSGLVELHGQHEPQSLFQPELHRSLLDRYGRLEDRVAEVRRAAVAAREVAERLDELRGKVSTRASRIELLGFRLDEFDKVAPQPDEEQELRRERERLRHAEEMGEALSASLQALYEGEGAALDLVHAAARRMRAHAGRDAAFEDLADRLDDVRAQLQEIATDVRAEREELVGDPSRLDEVEDRLLALERLRRRFEGATLADVLSSAQEMRRELDELQREDDSLEALERDLEQRLDVYEAAATGLSRARREAGERLADAVSKLLGDLAMKGARVEPQIESAEPRAAALSPSAIEGVDQVEFLLRANPGEPARPLRKIASGGEVSRIMLALDIALEAGLPARTLLFDEVDQGLGGEAAEMLGTFLRRASKRHQVICVTHLPQVAALADLHVLVAKKKRGGRTVAVVRVLDDMDDRVEELARMLGGTIVSDTARQHAYEMLKANTSGERR